MRYIIIGVLTGIIVFLVVNQTSRNKIRMQNEYAKDIRHQEEVNRLYDEQNKCLSKMILLLKVINYRTQEIEIIKKAFYYEGDQKMFDFYNSKYVKSRMHTDSIIMSLK